MKLTFTRVAAVALLAAVLVAGVGFVTRPVQAQDEMASIVCDADLILSLYTAEYNFGFAAIHDQMMMAEGGEMTGTDLAAIDKGQFAPLFDSMMAMMGDSMMMDGMMSEEMMTAVTEAMGMDMAEVDMMMMEMMPEGGEMATLVPAAIEGEPAECTALRDELRHFYTSLAYVNLSMAMMES